MEDKKKRLFQITEAARACGVSRSTLMRMEKCGLLTPAYVAEDSGRRYYDNFNVAHVLQVQKFRTMGLNKEEILRYYESGGQVTEALATLERKLFELQRGVEELRLRAGSAGSMSVSIMTLPETVCCMHRAIGRTVQDKYNVMFDFYGECVRKGFLLSEEPIFAISERSDYLQGYIGREDFPFYVCVPIKKKTAESVTLPACKVLSVLYYGDYDGVDQAWLTLGAEMKKRSLRPVGSPRVLGIVAPYTGKEIGAKRYCHRFVVPVEEIAAGAQEQEKRQENAKAKEGKEKQG